ncbi:MAG: hypothetical protein ABI647_24765 [Gemmatimonadota bacterium]
MPLGVNLGAGVILPVGVVATKRAEHRVEMSKTAAAAWSTLAGLRADIVTMDIELAVLDALGAPAPKTVPRTLSYTSPMFDPQGLVGPVSSTLRG